MEKTTEPEHAACLAGFTARVAAVAVEPDAEQRVSDFGPDVLERFFSAAAHLSDGDLAAVVTVARRTAMRSFYLRPTAALFRTGDDTSMRDWSAQRLSRRIEAAAVLVPTVRPLLSGKGGGDAAGRIHRMADEVASRFEEEVMDEVLVRGFALLSCLGPRPAPWNRAAEADYQWAGERHGLIAAHWDRFSRGPAIDGRTVAEIESLGATPLSVGAL